MSAYAHSRMGDMGLFDFLKKEDAEANAPYQIEDPKVKEYLQNKFSSQERQKIVDQISKENEGPNVLAGLAALGSGLQRKDALGAGQSFLKMQEDQRNQKLRAFDEGRQQLVNEIDFDRKMRADSEESDPNSGMSEFARQTAIRMGVKPDLVAGKSAGQMKSLLPLVEKMYNAEQAKLSRQEARMARQEEAMEKRQMAGTEGQKAVDKDYAKAYNQFTQKGAVNAKTAIDRLEALADEMEKDTGIGEAGGGRIASVLPDFMRSRDAIRRRDQARNFANTTLKELFGGQLSDAEREAAAKEYYNDALGNEENAKILRQKIAQLRDGFDTEMAKALYYEQNGTLKGFSGASNVMAKTAEPEASLASNSDEVPMIGPDGTRMMVKKSRVNAALKAGGKLISNKNVAGK